MFPHFYCISHFLHLLYFLNAYFLFFSVFFFVFLGSMLIRDRVEEHTENKYSKNKYSENITSVKNVKCNKNGETYGMKSGT